MADPEIEKKTSSSLTLNSSLLPNSVLESAKMADNATKEQTLLLPDWSLLPEELLELISTHVEKKNCFFAVDVIHARSVCNSWRSTFPFPSSQLLRRSYSLPAFADFPRETKDLCILEKIPLFLFRVKTQTQSPPCEYFIGGIAREDRMELSSPIQCSVIADLPESDPILNMLDCQIIPLGHHYRLVGEDMTACYKDFAFLQQGEEGEFVVLINYYRFLLVLRSSEMKWIRVESMSTASCKDIHSFRGKFYAYFENGDVFVIDPYSLEAIPLMPPEDLNWRYFLVPFGNEELFLVEIVVPVIDHKVDFNWPACRVSKLDEEAGEWIRVNDLGDRVLIIGKFGNIAFSGQDLPDGCGLSGNSILFTDYWPGELTYVYKYGLNPKYDLGNWRFSNEYRVLFTSEYLVLLHNRSPPVVAFRVERSPR